MTDPSQQDLWWFMDEIGEKQEDACIKDCQRCSFLAHKHSCFPGDRRYYCGLNELRQQQGDRE
jgi:hypothetical protein